MVGENPLSEVGVAVRAAVAVALAMTDSAAVCLGGGADSAVLAWAASDGTRPVRALFVDHSLPGSSRLAEAASALAGSVGLELLTVAAPVEEGPSLEGRARAVRRSALAGLRRPNEWLATGHSLDDQAETVLGRLLRGAGTVGLAGMEPRHFPFVRPLLGFSRAELRALAEQLRLPFVDDPANDDLRHLRNRLRLQLIPQLESDYNPALRAVLARTAAILAADDAELSRMADDVSVGERLGAMLLPVPVLTTLPVSVAARVVRRALRRFLDPYAGNHADVVQVLALAAAGSGRATLSGGVTAEVEGPYIAMHAGPPTPPRPARLSVPGSVSWADWRLEASHARPGVSRPARRQLLEPAVIGGGVEIRSAVVGDRIAIGSGSKLVRDALSEAGIPRRLRLVWPVILVGAKIAAVPAVRVAPWARPAGPDAVAVDMIERDGT
jgi:tRNA(Ile)-lysidine synthetase-like protein